MDVPSPTAAREPITVAAFLRAINVGGTAKLAMADLRRVAGLQGWANARTYLASGNLIGELDPAAVSSAATIMATETELEAAIADAVGLSTTVMIRTRPQLVAVLERAPFAAPQRECHVGFFKARPQAERDAAAVSGDEVNRLRELVAPDEFVLSGDEVFLRYEAGQARTKLTAAALSRTAGSPLTVRGMRTITGILERC